MKAVFLTPDRIVDRRIVLEAESLAARGFETVVVADLGAGVAEDRSYAGVRIINAVSAGGAGSGRKSAGSLFSSLKDPLKAALGGFPGIRRFLRKSYFFLFHVLQFAKPMAEKRLYPLEDSFFLQALNEKGDLYVACDLPMLPAAYRAATERKATLIYDAHEFYTEQHQLSLPEKRITREVEKALIDKARLVITVNESIAALFEKRYGIRRPSVIYNCMAKPVAGNEKSNILRERLSLGENEKIVLFQGGFLPGRNLENLVLGAKYMGQGILIVLLGFGEFRKRLENLTKGCSHVKFLDAVGQDVLLSYTAGADLGIIPYEPIDLNTKFCTPNKLFEFIQAGLPVLAEERLEELSQFIESEKIGFLRDLSTPGKIAAALRDILSREEELKAAKSRCIEIAPLYSWEKEGARFADLVEEAIGRE